MVYASPGTDASTDPDIDKNIRMTLRRLAQNREAARKSRLRKKAYVQQLEDSRMKLTQLEQELQRARQQGIIISTSGDQQRSTSENEALAFNMEYMRWLEEHNKQINELRSAVHTHAGDDDLQNIVSSVMAHHEEIFRIKGLAAKADALHVLSATWRTPLESNAADHTAAALGKIGDMESLLQQADDLRMQSLQKMQRVLTTRQSARALLLVSDYFSRLRALNSLWIARPQQ
ncbi:hypothetical protein OsJ_19031 [Oryza sativa Japonica Group]|uniref:Uncharacterized protein n=1 Tax=Oryza sativa subsp. japonica TaxID=39947 RepID=B9FK63_ORYSJ|nr:hypothetical protein OsJ_19031 [Oryza sativa Japonica Group]